MKLFRIAKGKCHYVHQFNQHLLINPASGVRVFLFHARIYKNLNKFEDILMLIGFESVSKYLEHRTTFWLKTGFWESPCKSDCCVSMQENGVSWNDQGRPVCSQVWDLMSYDSLGIQQPWFDIITWFLLKSWPIRGWKCMVVWVQSINRCEEGQLSPSLVLFSVYKPWSNWCSCIMSSLGLDTRERQL